MIRLAALVALVLSTLGLGTFVGAEPLAAGVVTPEPGTWPGPLSVEVQLPPGASARYRFLETPSAATFPWSGPLVLDALAGEHRSYTLRLSVDLASGESVTRDYRYVVARAAEPQPTVRPVPGIYGQPTTVVPELPDGWTLTVDGRVVQGPLDLDAPDGSQRNWVLDVRGPGGKSLSWAYTIDLRDQGPPTLDVISPLPGTWANAQTLVVAFQGVDRVVWSYGNSLDPSQARDYDGPVALDSGERSLTVSAHSRTGRWITKTVTWTSGTEPAPPGWPTSGQGSVEFPPVPGQSVSWDEGRSWETSASPRREQPSEAGRKILSVQIRGRTGVQRYVYWLDARAVLAPSLVFSGGWNPQVHVSGSVEAYHRVRWTFADGKTADGEGLWGPSGSWKVPDGVVAARVSVRGANGLTASPANVAFPVTGWATPEWEPWDQKGPTGKGKYALGGRILPRPGFSAVYEVSDQASVAEPGPKSPVLNGALVPTLPWGADRLFFVRFAWRDASGLVGPATDPVVLRVDRVPPPAPEVVQVGGQILVKVAGADEGTELFWAVTPERVASVESLSFQPFLTALDTEGLKVDAGGKLWFHAQARDPAGNLGQARLNVALGTASPSDVEVVQVDPDPSVGEVDVVDGAVYPWSQFRLRAAEQGRSFWVGVTDQNTLPSDWGARVQPWTGLVTGAVVQGDRRRFLVYWNEKTADGWAWEKPKVLALTLDHGPPVQPVVEGSWPSAPLSSPWSLSVHPGQVGDVLRYSFTLDGSLPPDPLKAGQPWPGVETWEAPADAKVVVRVRIAAVSVSGLSTELALPDPVVLDRTLPPAALPPLEPFTWSASPLVVPVSPGVLVRYTLTTDGSTPPVPGSSSPLVVGPGMVLEGVSDQTVLYRFRWRTYSAAGLAGQPGDAYSVLVDRTTVLGSPPATPIDGIALAPPRILGFPASGVTSAPVVLRSDVPSTDLRYEVAEGVALARPVSVQSPLWNGSLTLDGGEGVDRVFHLSVRRYGSNGIPTSPEASYSVRIDRSLPGPANFSVAADPRRPEALVAAAPGNPDEQMVYRWFWDSFPEGHAEGPWTTLSGSPVLQAPVGALSRLRVQAFLRDEAGNEGPTVEKALLVDQNVVYVAPQATGGGTRESPSGSLIDALAKARKEGRTAIFAAAGNLTAGQTLELGGLQIYGGWDPSLWETGPSTRTTIATVAPFQGSSLVECGSLALTLNRVDLNVEAGLKRVISADAAQVVIKDSSWNWTASQGGWTQAGGSVTLAGVSAVWAGQTGAVLFDFKGVELKAKNLGLTSNRNSGVLVSLRDGASVVQDLRISSRKAQGYEGVLSISGGSLTIDGTRILAGDGADQVVALVARNAEVSVWNAEVNLFGEKANTGIQVQGGHLEVQNSTITLVNGAEFNQALVLVKTEARVHSTKIAVNSGTYQGGLTLDSGSLTFQNSDVDLAGGGKRAWGAQFLGACRVVVEDATWNLAVKTPGDVWLLQKPWVEGSSATRSNARGW